MGRLGSFELLMLGSVGVVIKLYLAILGIKFLKSGIEAFELYKRNFEVKE